MNYKNKQICLRLIILIFISYMLSSCHSGQSHQASNTSDNLQNYKHALNEWLTSCNKSATNIDTCKEVYNRLNQAEAEVTDTIELNFEKYGLKNIPPLFIFKNLNNIDLSYNKITTIPTNAFAGLSSLQRIDLSNNKITEIPTNAFTGLSSLREINLYNNQITEIPTNAFAELSSLKAIYLNDNQIKTIPTNAFAGLSFLQRIDLSNNKITAISTNAFVSLENGAEIYMCITDTNLQSNLEHDYPELSFYFDACD